MKRKHIVYLASVFAVAFTFIASIMLVTNITNQLLYSKINTVLLLLTFTSNFLIWFLTFMLYSYGEDITEISSEARETVEEFLDRLKNAGLTIDKLEKFEPIIDELAEVVDEVEPEKVNMLMEKGLEYLEYMNGSDEEFDEEFNDQLDELVKEGE